MQQDDRRASNQVEWSPASVPVRKRSQRVRLTEARIQATKSTSEPVYVYDLDVPGLTIRATSGGIRTFVLVKKIAGRARRITLGRWPGLKLSGARTAATRILGEIAAGGDPIERREAARRQAETCNDFWPTYLKHIKRQNRTWQRDENRWSNDIAPFIGRKPIASITTADCQKIVDHAGRTKPVEANRIAALMGAFFAQALKSERATKNPARGLSRYEETPRDRFLSSAEVQAFLGACEKAPEPWGSFFALLLWTGARKGAVMAMKWSDVNLDNAVWHIPAAIAKNKKVATIPLVAPAIAILRRRLAVRDNSAWVFPASS